MNRTILAAAITTVLCTVANAGRPHSLAFVLGVAASIIWIVVAVLHFVKHR